MEPILNSSEANATKIIKIRARKSERKNKKIENNLSEKRYYTIEEVAGPNWRDGLDEIEDEWE